MEYIRCSEHPDTTLLMSTEGGVCPLCKFKEKLLSERLREFPPSGLYEETMKADLPIVFYPECDACGIHWKVTTTTHKVDLIEKAKLLCGPDCKGPEWKSFHTADYFTCDDIAEGLSIESWDTAIEEFFDGWFDSRTPGLSMDEILERQGSVSVFAWKRKVLPTSFGFGESAIDSMLESFEEDYWCEEYGCPFEEGNPPWDKEKLEVVKKKLYATMEECVQIAHIWQCEIVAEKTFEEDEIRKILKRTNPEWWDATT